MIEALDQGPLTEFQNDTFRDLFVAKNNELAAHISQETNGNSAEFLLKNYRAAAGVLYKRIAANSVSEADAIKQLLDIHELFTFNTFHGGSIEEFTLPSVFDPNTRSGIHMGFITRLRLGQLYLSDADLVNHMVSTRSVLGHGSRSGSLLGVIHNGLRPQGFLDAHDIGIYTGEHVFGGTALNQDYVSTVLSTDFNVLNRYASPSTGEIHESEMVELIRNIETELQGLSDDAPIFAGLNLLLRHKRKMLEFLRSTDSDDQSVLHKRMITENFPIIYFIDGSGFDPATVLTHKSGIKNEVWVKDGISMGNIPLILVPNERVSWVRSLVDNKCDGVAVLPLEGYQVPPYITQMK